MMKNFKAILRRYSRTTDGIVLGEVEEKEISLDMLRQDIEALRSSHKRTFFILLLAVLTVFLGSLIIVVAFLRDPNQITVLFGAAGITIAGLITTMRNIWKEQVAIEMTLALLVAMSPDSFEPIIEILLKKF